MDLIYLDHAATTPVRPEVLEAMLPYFSEHFGNPSSIHAFGRQTRIAISRARDTIAACLNCSPSEFVFTGGGTESDNMALFGAAAAYGKDKKHIVTTRVEHHAVLRACERLERQGYDVTYVPVDAYGRVKVDEIERAVRPDTFLISVMFGNNEVGTLQPIEEIGRMAHERNILFHVDAVQALGLMPLDLTALPVDLMSFSSHKIYGPKGTGGLYISRKISLAPLIVGGSQERNRRAGTENVAGIVGFAEAVRLAVEHRETHAREMETLRREMIRQLDRELGPSEYVVNGHPIEHLPHILNVSFPGADTETLLMNMDMEGIAASSGSACSSGSLETSHVLRAMELPEVVTRSAVRFSFGTGNRIEQIGETVRKLSTILQKIRHIR